MEASLVIHVGQWSLTRCGKWNTTTVVVQRDLWREPNCGAKARKQRISCEHVQTFESQYLTYKLSLICIGVFFPAAEAPLCLPVARHKIEQIRVNFDAVMMLLMRHIMEGLSVRSADVSFFYIFIDGSPTSGYEALIVAELFVVGSMWWNRLLPISYLGFGYLTLPGKLFGFLWKLFLESGPDIALLRWRLRAIRGFSSDFGVEAGVADSKDVLPSFLQYIGCVLPCSQERFLFPLAVWSRGWHHLWDQVAQEIFITLATKQKPLKCSTCVLNVV